MEGSPQIQFYVNAGRRNDVISQNIYENGAAVWPPRFFASYLPGGWAPDGVAARGSVEATEKLYERHYLVIKIVSSFFACLIKFLYL